MEDLQSLLEKINRDGVEKAEAEAKKIVEAARAKAEAIMREARAEAEKAKAEAEKAAADYRSRAAETIRQSARDVVIGVGESVRALLERILRKDVDAALGNERIAAGVVAEAISGLTGPGEIACGSRLASVLRAQLSAGGAFTVVTDESLGTGFTVRLDGGRVEHAFTGEVIADELAKRLRPDLAALMK